MRRRYLANAVIAFGIISGIVSIFAAPVWLRVVAGISCAGIVAYLAYIRMIYQRQVDQVGPVRNIFAAPYSVMPAVEGDIDWIWQTAQRVYTGIDVIPKETMLAWYRVNPTGFSVIKSSRGELSGNLDILPLKPEVLDLFKEGELIEREIKGSYLYSPAERSEIKDLYVESFVAVNGSKRGNPWAAYECLMTVPLLVERICRPEQVRYVYAIAASRAGKELVRHLGFSLVSQKSSRRDEHDLFYVAFLDLCNNLTTSARLESQLKFTQLLSSLGHEEPTL